MVTQERATVSVEEAADMLGISRSLAYAAVRRGHIPALYFGVRRIRIPLAALEKMLSTASQEKSAKQNGNS